MQHDDQDGFRVGREVRSGSEHGTTTGRGEMAPGKRTATQGHRASDPTSTILRGLDAAEAGLASVTARHLPAMRAAIDARDMIEARSASAALTWALARIDAELATARRWATLTESAGAATLLEPLEAARDACRAEAAPVLALAPPPAPASDVDVFDFAAIADAAPAYDATEDANRDQWSAQLDAAEAPRDNVIDASDRFGAVQRRATGGAQDPANVQQHAAVGVAGTGGTLPHLDAIQASFGAHDVSGLRAHVGGAAADASAAIGAEAYATGNDVAFASAPSLFVAAHEAAHVVQQRAGVSLLGGVGETGDAYEQHADAVAEKVVRGETAVGLLGEARSGTASSVVQAFGLDEKTMERLHLVARLRELDTTELKIYVSSSILLAVSSYVSAVEKAELHDSMQTPDNDLWSVILEVFFGALPALVRLGNPKALAKVVGLEADVVVEVANTSTDPALFTAALDGAKEAAKSALPTGRSSSDFYDSMKDSANEAAQMLVRDALATSDRITLLQLALAYDYADHHGVAHYYPIVKRTIDAYRQDVVPVGTEHQDDMYTAGDHETITDTEIAAIEHKGNTRPAMVRTNRYDNHLGDQYSDGYSTFVRWVSEEMNGLAEERQTKLFGGSRMIPAIELKKKARVNGRSMMVPAHEVDDSLAQWMAYGDDHDLWPTW